MSSPLRIPRRRSTLLKSLAAGAALAAVALSGCGGTASPGAAFSVNGTTYSKSDFESLARDLIAAGQFTTAKDASEIKASEARVVLQELVRYEAFVQFAAERKITIDPAIRREILSQAEQDSQFASYSPALQDVLINLSVAGEVVNSLKAPSETALKSDYAASPAKVGVLCLSHILVKTEAKARDIIGQLDDGADFALLAKKYSIEPGAINSGGALKSNGEDCSSLGSLQEAFDRDFMAAAVRAKVGVPTGPVKTQFGYHVILARPVNDVAESLVKVASENPGANALQGYLTTADITVASVYGRWDGAVAKIV